MPKWLINVAPPLAFHISHPWWHQHLTDTVFKCDCLDIQCWELENYHPLQSWISYPDKVKTASAWKLQYENIYEALYLCQWALQNVYTTRTQKSTVSEWKLKWVYLLGDILWYLSNNALYCTTGGLDMMPETFKSDVIKKKKQFLNYYITIWWSRTHDVMLKSHDCPRFGSDNKPSHAETAG